MTMAAVIAFPLATWGADDVVRHVGQAAPVLPASPAAEEAALAATASVAVRDFEYEDAQNGNMVTTIHVGDSVVWTWESGTHTVTHGTGTVADAAAGGQFDSGFRTAPAPGQTPVTFTRSFGVPGVFPYACKLHSDMHGVVVVA